MLYKTRSDGKRLRLVVAALVVGIVAGGAPLANAAGAQAAGPIVATDGVHATGATTASVSGNADPEGQSTTLHADYGPAGGLWCTSDGKEGTPSETAPENLGSGNVMYSEIVVGLEGLTPGSEYCVELVATNASGTTLGGQRQFTTPARAASPPTVATDGVHATGATTASVSGNADPEGQSTTLHADYGPAGGLWCTSDGKEGTPSETAPENLGSGNVMYSEIVVGLEGLTPGSEYCVELVATNASGTTLGGQRQFTTPARAASPPTVATELSRLGTSPTTAPPTDTAKPKPLTNAQKLARALRACQRKPKRQRATCEKQAREKYGATKKTGKQANKAKR